jgi:hypothetical protein
MSTVMEDKIKQAFEEWKKQDHSTESTAMKVSTNKGLSDQLMAYIQTQPGITGAELRKIVKEKFPQTPSSYVPAILKGLFDAHFVGREERPKTDGFGRSTFAYFALTSAEREVAREKARLNPIQPKPKYTKKKAERVEVVTKPAKGITALVPAKRHATHALDVGPTTVTISIATSTGVSYSLNINDAKFIYTQLNQIFGGVR